MSFRTFPLLAALFLPALWAEAQVSVAVSDEIVLRTGDVYEIIGAYDEHTLLLHVQDDQMDVYGYDNDMKQAWSRALDLPKRGSFVGLVAQEAGFAIIYTLRRRDDHYAYVHLFDAQAQLVDSTLITVFEGRAFTPSFSLVIDQQHRYFSLYHFPRANRAEVVTFDLEAMRRVRHVDERFDDMTYNDDFYQAIQDHKGRFHAVFLPSNSRFGRRNNRFSIMRLEEGGTRYYDAHLNGMLIYDAYFAYDEAHDQLIGTGLFDDTRNSRVKGAFFMRVPSAQPEAYTVAFEGFSKELMSTIIGKEAGSDATFTDAFMRQPILRNDGGCVMVFERARVRVRGGAANVPFNGGMNPRIPAGRPQTDYNFDDIVLLCFGPEGRVEWHEVLFKRQYSQDDDGIYSGYMLMKQGQALKVMYNDEIKQENTVSGYTIGLNGGQVRSNLLNTKDQKIQMRFRVGLQTGLEEAVVPSERRRWLRLVRLRYAPI